MKRFLAAFYIFSLGVGLSAPISFAEGLDDYPLLPPFLLTGDSSCEATRQLQAAGPLFEMRADGHSGWLATRPFYYRAWDCASQTQQVHFLYPMASRYESPGHVRADFLGLVKGRRSVILGGPVDEESMIFPFYFSRSTGNPCTSYRGIFPLGGNLRNILGYDEWRWVLFPLYLRMERRGEVRTAAPWPFIQWMTGPCSEGFAFWPLMGRFERQGSYRHEFFLWPLVYNFWDDLDKPTRRHRYGILPFFAREVSANTYQSHVLWPFFGYIVNREPAYEERHFFWPFLVQGKGDGHIVNRWAPFYTYSCHNGRHKRWVMWPIFKQQCWQEKELEITRSQLLYFFVWHETQRSLDPCRPFCAEKTHIWPLLSRWRNGQGCEQFQFISPFEVFFPNSSVVRRLYTPLFSLYRYERSETGYTRQSILFNSIVFESQGCCRRLTVGPLFECRNSCRESRLEILKGLISIGQEDGRNKLKLFWISLF